MAWRSVAAKLRPKSDFVALIASQNSFRLDVCRKLTSCQKTCVNRKIVAFDRLCGFPTDYVVWRASWALPAGFGCSCGRKLISVLSKQQIMLSHWNFYDKLRCCQKTLLMEKPCIWSFRGRSPNRSLWIRPDFVLDIKAWLYREQVIRHIIVDEIHNYEMFLKS